MSSAYSISPDLTAPYGKFSVVASRRAPKSKPSHKALGQAVRAARDEKGLTQVEFAKKAGLHVSYLSGVETGQRNPTLTALSQIAVALGLKLSELIKRAEGQ